MNPSEIRPFIEPSEAEIQHAAYLIWIENGRPEGRELDHWLAAREKLLHREHRPTKPARRAAPRRASTTSSGRN